MTDHHRPEIGQGQGQQTVQAKRNKAVLLNKMAGGLILEEYLTGGSEAFRLEYTLLIMNGEQRLLLLFSLT